MRSGCRLDISMRNKSVTSGSGRNEESMKEEQNSPTPPKAGSVVFSQLTSRPVAVTFPKTSRCEREGSFFTESNPLGYPQVKFSAKAGRIFVYGGY